MDDNLIGKNVILISPRYFGYETEIKTALEEKGAHVYYINDRIKDSTISKALFRLNLRGKRAKKRVLAFFDEHLQQAKKGTKIDYLIAIIPEGFSKEVIEYYKENLRETIFILYMWDSVENRPYIIDTLGLYDYTYTFDKLNSEKYNIAFRPLFYTNDYSEIGKLSENYKYELSFIGTAHSDRYTVIQQLVKSVKKKLSTFLFFYLQHPLIGLYYKITDPKFKNVKFKDISYRGLPKEKVLEVLRHSRCVIDINHPKQTGLTIRTLEVLGAKRKLITTNKDVANYDFYNPSNVLIIERDNPFIDESFLQTPYQPISQEVYEKYSIANWIRDILNIKQS